MGLFSLLEAAVKTVVVLPVSIVEDAVDIVVANPKPIGSNTADVIKSIKEDVDEIAD